MSLSCPKDLNLPSKKTESWRWTDLGLLSEIVNHTPQQDISVDPLAFSLADTPAARLVFVDGTLWKERSHQGSLQFVSCDQERFAPLFCPDYPLAVAARACVDKVLSFHVPAHHQGGVVEIIHIGSGGGSHVVLDLALAENAQLSIRESHIGYAKSWTNMACLITLADGARLDRITRRLGEGGVHSETCVATLHENAHYEGLAILAAAAAARLETHVCLDGTGAQAYVNGLVVAQDTSRYDIINNAQHKKPQGKSDQVWRILAKDQAIASVAAQTYVAPGAQQTKANQSVRGILLSPSAMIRERPQMEIYADDVECTHGATVGALEEQALFYMASRGIPLVLAQTLLLKSFLEEPMAHIKEDTLRTQLLKSTPGFLGEMEDALVFDDQ